MRLSFWAPLEEKDRSAEKAVNGRRFYLIWQEDGGWARGGRSQNRAYPEGHAKTTRMHSPAPPRHRTSNVVAIFHPCYLAYRSPTHLDDSEFGCSRYYDDFPARFNLRKRDTRSMPRRGSAFSWFSRGLRDMPDSEIGHLLTLLNVQVNCQD